MLLVARGIEQRHRTHGDVAVELRRGDPSGVALQFFGVERPEFVPAFGPGVKAPAEIVAPSPMVVPAMISGAAASVTMIP